MNYLDRHEVLKRHYANEISDWDWEGIESDAYDNLCWNDTPDEVEFRTWLGSVVSLFPSGKIYAPWTTNQTREDVTRDQAYTEALEEIAEQHGLSISYEDGNVFAVIYSSDDIFFDTTKEEFIYQGEVIATTENELLRWMESEGYYPNVFSVSDHGNLSYYQFETKVE